MKEGAQPVELGCSFLSCLSTSDWVLLSSIAAATAIAAAGWAITYFSNRRLQRKQLAIQLLLAHRFEQVYMDAAKAVFESLRTDTDSDYYSNLFKDHINKRTNQSDEDKELCNNIKIILNYFEFLSIAVLSKTVNDGIMWHSISGSFEHVYRKLETTIKTIQKEEKDDTFYCNFMTLAEKWKNKGDPIAPIS